MFSVISFKRVSCVDLVFSGAAAKRFAHIRRNIGTPTAAQEDFGLRKETSRSRGAVMKDDNDVLRLAQ